MPTLLIIALCALLPVACIVPSRISIVEWPCVSRAHCRWRLLSKRNRGACGACGRYMRQERRRKALGAKGSRLMRDGGPAFVSSWCREMTDRTCDLGNRCALYPTGGGAIPMGAAPCRTSLAPNTGELGGSYPRASGAEVVAITPEAGPKVVCHESQCVCAVVFLARRQSPSL